MNISAKFTPPEVSPQRVVSLDVLRGLAVLAVMLLHSGEHARGQGVPLFEELLWPVLRHGYLGVQLFFAISGYCISGAVDSALRNPTPLRTYCARRVRRIYPPYWASLVLAIGLGLVTVVVLKRSWWSVFPLSPLDWLLNVLLLQGPFGGPDAVLVYWSLTVEVQFYAIMALCVLFPRGKSVWLLALSVFYAYWAWRPSLPIGGTPLAYWPEFACGIAAYAAHHPRGFLPGTPWALWGLSALAIILGLTHMTEPFSVDGELATPLKQLFCLGCGLMIWRLRNYESWIARSRLLMVISLVGVISYSLYLTHVPITTRVFNLAGRMNWSVGPKWYAVAVFSGVLQFGIGWLFYHFCERPWVNRPQRGKAANRASSLPPHLEPMEAVAG